MHIVDPKTLLLDISGAPIRRLAVDWRDTLRTVGSLAEKNPNAPVQRVLEAAAQVIGQAEGTDMTLADAAVEALLNGKGAEACSGAEKLQRWELARRFRTATEKIGLKADEVLFVQVCLADAFKPGVYGPAHDALNGVRR